MLRAGVSEDLVVSVALSQTLCYVPNTNDISRLIRFERFAVFLDAGKGDNKMNSHSAKVAHYGLMALLLALASAPLSQAQSFETGALPAWSFQQAKQGDEEPDKKELELKACGPKDIKHRASTDKKKERPTLGAPADKALVFVVRPTGYGRAVQTKLAVDREWKGVNRGNNYFFFTLDPGEHHFCSQAENRSVTSLQVEAGKTYFLQQKIRMGFNKARNRLEVLDEEEGRKALAKCHLSLSEEK